METLKSCISEQLSTIANNEARRLARVREGRHVLHKGGGSGRIEAIDRAHSFSSIERVHVRLLPACHSPTVTCDLRLLTCNLSLVTCDLWLVTCDLWLVTCDLCLVTFDLYGRVAVAPIFFEATKNTMLSQLRDLPLLVLIALMAHHPTGGFGENWHRQL